MSKLTKIEKEKQTIELMIRLYCFKKEKNTTVCPSCWALIEYAHRRLDHCPLGENKSSCKKCSIHCYSPSMKQRIKDIMRYSGPWMLIFAPVQALRHLVGK